jgi:hypothetical protein
MDYNMLGIENFVVHSLCCELMTFIAKANMVDDFIGEKYNCALEYARSTNCDCIPTNAMSFICDAVFFLTNNLWEFHLNYMLEWVEENQSEGVYLDYANSLKFCNDAFKAIKHLMRGYEPIYNCMAFIREEDHIVLRRMLRPIDLADTFLADIMAN